MNTPIFVRKQKQTSSRNNSKFHRFKEKTIAKYKTFETFASC